MSEDADQPNADADSRETSRAPSTCGFGGELSSSGLPGCSGAGGRVLSVHRVGTNLLGLSLLLRRFDAVVGAESAHLNVDEYGALE